MSIESATDIADSYGLFINGVETASKSNDTFKSVNPANGAALTTVALGKAEDVNNAVETARQAFESWSATDPAVRGRLLGDLADAIRNKQERLGRILALENGKPLSEAVGEISMGARYFEFYAGAVDKIRGDTVPLGNNYIDYTIKEPLGVTAQIIPWNFPVDILGRSVAPALASGNTCVVKPAQLSSLLPLEIAQLAEEVGFPDGVYNVVTGRGSETGAALASHKRINGISFTGSVMTGIEVAKMAAKNVTPVHLELGGKSPAVIYPDADIERAVREVVDGRFTNCGQTCTACTRAIVHKDIHKQFVDKLIAIVDEMELGPGIKDPDIGPMISHDQVETVSEFLSSGRTEVGEPVVGGVVPDRAGSFIQPTVFDDVESDTRLAQEEIFGPVLSVLTFSEESEAIKIANDIDYGLNAAVFTENINRAHRFARDIKAGRVGINEWFAGGEEAPFGGYKHSGYGREGGLEAIDSYTQVKNVCADIGDR